MKAESGVNHRKSLIWIAWVPMSLSLRKPRHSLHEAKAGLQLRWTQKQVKLKRILHFRQLLRVAPVQKP